MVLRNREERYSIVQYIKADCCLDLENGCHEVSWWKRTSGGQHLSIYMLTFVPYKMHIFMIRDGITPNQ